MEVKKFTIIAGIILIGFLIFFYFLNYSTITIYSYESSLFEDDIHEKKVHYLDAPSFEKQNLSIKTRDSIIINLDNRDYEFYADNINGKKKQINFIINDLEVVLIKGSEYRRFDLNRDGYYDIEIYADSFLYDNARITISNISQEISTIELLDNRIRDTLIRVEERSLLIIYLILIVLIGIFIMLIVYFIRLYVLPVIELNKKIEKESPFGAIVYMYMKFNEAKDNNQKNQAKKIATKIKHLYNYLSKDEKKKFKSKLDKVENYINLK